MRLLTKIKQYAIADIIKIILAKYFKTKIMRLHYLKANIDYNNAQAEIENIEFKVKKLTYSDFLQGDPTVFNGKKLELIRERCNNSSYIAYGVFSDNLLIFSAWISLKYLGLPIKLKTKLNKDEGLIEDVYCHPNSRGKGIYSTMIYYFFAKLYEGEKKHCVTIVLHGNIYAYKAVTKAGFKDLGTFLAGEILGKPFTTLNKKMYDHR